MRYMCIYACAVLLIAWWAGWSFYWLVVGHRVATLLVARGSRYSPCVTISGASKVRRAVEGKPVLICNWLFRLFSRHISRTQSFQQNRHVDFHALVALKLMVSLISRLVACSARIVVDRQTDRHTDHPRCACAPRVTNPLIAC